MTNHGHPALRQTPQERIDQHRARYEQLKKNARYGVPPWTVDDCRFVLWLLDGERVEQKRRCEACNATGEEYASDTARLFAAYGAPAPFSQKVRCLSCDGTGYMG